MLTILVRFISVVATYGELNLGGMYVDIRGSRVRVYDLQLLKLETAFLWICHAPRSDSSVAFPERVEIERGRAITDPVGIWRPKKTMTGTSSASGWHTGNFDELVGIRVKCVNSQDIIAQVGHHEILSSEIHDYVVTVRDILGRVRAHWNRWRVQKGLDQLDIAPRWCIPGSHSTASAAY